MKTNHENLKSNVPFDELPEWFKSAKTINADVVFEKFILTWKSGTWQDGVWQYGVWQYGTWKSGTWKDGIWQDGIWQDGIWQYGTWQYGVWQDGVWQYGTWQDGVWQYGVWQDGTWKSGVWQDGVWQYGVWQYGIWQDGTWQRGYKGIIFCKWNVFYSDNTITIGCKEKSIKDWDDWFDSSEVYETKRNTQQFKQIEKAYKLAKYAIELEKN